MIRTILIISITLGAKTKFQVRVVLFSLPADRAFMLCDGLCLLQLMLELHAPLDLGRF